MSHGEKTAFTDIVEQVFIYEEECDLGGHGLQRRKRDLVSAHTEPFGYRVEEPDLGENKY